jgi:hypothetical protein
VKKSSLIALICIIGAVAVNSVTALSLAAILSPQQTYAHVPEPYSTTSPCIQSVTKTNSYYNISIAFSNVTYAETVDNILVNPNSPANKTDPTIYLNGTVANTYPLANLQRGDSLRVDVTVPCSEYAPDSTLYLNIICDCCGSGKYIQLP